MMEVSSMGTVPWRLELLIDDPTDPLVIFTMELSMQTPVSVSKPTDLRGGGPELWISYRW